MTCWPCIKEIIDNGARVALENLHNIATSIPSLVAQNRMSTADAEYCLNAIIELEKDFTASAHKLALEVADKAANPWDKIG